MSLLVTSCGTGTEMPNTITVKQAEQGAEEYFRKALAVLPDKARPVVGLIHTYPCDNGPEGRMIASVDYEILDLPRDSYSDYVSELERWWRDHDFRILDDERPTEESVWVENNDDGFRMRVTASKGGKFILIATSPCVWPDGTPAA
jgi:hypothetical protein